MTTGEQPASLPARITEAAPSESRVDLTALLSTLHTADVAAIAVAAIGVLDARGGDCDLEEDDPSGDALDVGESPSDDGRRIAAVAPRYGTDQRRGPRNYCRHHGLAIAA